MSDHTTDGFPTERYEGPMAKAVQPADDMCPDCNGHGTIFSPTEPLPDLCYLCSGTGKVALATLRAAGTPAMAECATCDHCAEAAGVVDALRAEVARLNRAFDHQRDALDKLWHAYFLAKIAAKAYRQAKKACERAPQPTIPGADVPVAASEGSK